MAFKPGQLVFGYGPNVCKYLGPDTDPKTINSVRYQAVYDGSTGAPLQDQPVQTCNAGYITPVTLEYVKGRMEAFQRIADNWEKLIYSVMDKT
jgi:hypothetical protein